MTRPIPQPTARRRAFTLLEVLIVVVLLGILSTLLIVGIEKLAVGAKRQQTRAALEQARSLYAEWNSVAQQSFPPSVMPCPQNVQLTDRYAPAVWFTRDVMFHIRSAPANTAAFGKLAPASVMTFPAMSTATFPAPYTPTLWTGMPPNAYAPFESGDYGRVYIRDPSDTTGMTYDYYDCILAFPQPPAAGSTVSPPNDPKHWFSAYPVFTGSTTGGTVPADNSVPVLLDGWGNPIIFVPGGTLGTGTALSADGTIVAASGSMRSGTGTSAISTQVRSPDGRPFFASAGPDNDFSNGDDNQYSFEK